ncbi:MAG: 16S rRNA (uracil(1498)-N(3))-methyltransferase [Opitutaceae bacterium]|nr:16S rRNA (uracil(1498)-N(3))-methyltransferase [Opitutaceae bacterium]
MPDFRAYCTPASAEPAEITLAADESHHLVTVNRAREGDPVVAFDGRGTEWHCDLVAARRAAAVLRVRTRRQHPAPPCEITLGQALPKGATMDAIVRKATELGARRLAPLETERTQVHLAADRSDRKGEKWRTAALEAAKQCGNPFVPDLLPVQDLRAFLATTADAELKLIASLAPGAQPLKAVFAAFRAAHARPPRTAAWLIGPEGDFSPAELAAAQAAGFAPVTLGPLVLRCETAAIYALSVLRHETASDA